MKRRLCQILILITLALVFPPRAHSRQYLIQPLGTLGGGFDRARAVSSSGTIVGEALIPAQIGIEHAFAWRNNVVVDLGTLGGAKSRALDVNADGFVAGWSLDASGSTRPVYWDSTDQIHELATLGGRSGTAWAVNNAGTVAGSASRDDGATRAVIWSGLSVLDLGTLGGTYSTAYEVNNLGTVVGAAQDAWGRQQACLWTDAGPTNLGSLSGGLWNTARGVNDNGQVILWGKPAGASSNRASLWGGGLDDVVIDLGTFGGDESWAYGLNNLGQVVGWAEDQLGIYRAFVYDGTEMIDLGTLGGLFSSAYGISDDGTIVGYAQNADGMWQAVRWVAVPEPTTLATILTALAGLAFFRGLTRLRFTLDDCSAGSRTRSQT